MGEIYREVSSRNNLNKLNKNQLVDIIIGFDKEKMEMVKIKEDMGYLHSELKERENWRKKALEFRDYYLEEKEEKKALKKHNKQLIKTIRAFKLTLSTYN